jgi:hypothetical protein
MWPRPIAQPGVEFGLCLGLYTFSREKCTVPFRASVVFFCSIKVADIQVADVDVFLYIDLRRLVFQHSTLVSQQSYDFCLLSNSFSRNYEILRYHRRPHLRTPAHRRGEYRHAVSH